MIAAPDDRGAGDREASSGGQGPVGQPHAAAAAPADSLASVQIRESVINNVVERLGSGRPDVHAARALPPHRPLPQPPGAGETIPTTTTLSITLRPQGRRAGALRRRASGSVRLDRQLRQGQAGLEGLSGAGVLSSRDRRAVRPSWSATASCSSSARASPPESQIVLRGVFSRAFSKKTPWSMTPERLATDPKLADLGITQFVIDDGWIGVALGPRRVRWPACRLVSRRGDDPQIGLHGAEPHRPERPSSPPGLAASRRRVEGEHVELHLGLRARGAHGHELPAGSRSKITRSPSGPRQRPMACPPARVHACSRR